MDSTYRVIKVRQNKHTMMVCVLLGLVLFFGRGEGISCSLIGKLHIHQCRITQRGLVGNGGIVGWLHMWGTLVDELFMTGWPAV